MAKALMGAAILGVAAAEIGAAFFTGGASLALFAVENSAVLQSLLTAGVAMEAGAIADALTQNRGMNITTRQPASYGK